MSTRSPTRCLDPYAPPCHMRSVSCSGHDTDTYVWYQHARRQYRTPRSELVGCTATLPTSVPDTSE
eukprot:269287-Rhodomonas_salina.3